MELYSSLHQAGGKVKQFVKPFLCVPSLVAVIKRMLRLSYLAGLWYDRKSLIWNKYL